KVSRRLVNENQALVVESVKPKNMLKNHRLAEAIADAAWGKFIGMLAYKLRREGKVLVKIDTFYPSSKTCSCCGFKLPELELKTRKWSCPKCGALHDRDINAAVNIKAEGIRQLRAAGLSVLRSAELSGNCEIALGDGVRPRENRGCCR
ncbi:transposase, partial [Sutterella sp.]|uniref:RNA-guided endonuclease InsQ/TnpB family protein n=1 Tax=Sutterella sp. TaxID=1981025 RepID=UPI0026E0FBF1